jgi:hypothetical protein
LKQILLVLFALCAASTADGWFLQSETGMVFDTFNDVRVPNATGTYFSLVDDLDADPGLFARLRFGREFGRHSVSILVAPLRLESSGTLDRDVSFEGVVFPESTAVEADYRFDSYRLTWRYGVVRRPALSIDLGLTAKIRDASIRITGGDQEAITRNTGFVPLASFALDWGMTPELHLLIDGDAAAASQGRAEDVYTGLGWAFTPGSVLTAGWRFIEGGADVDQVYNFTFLSYASIGYRLQF